MNFKKKKKNSHESCSKSAAVKSKNKLVQLFDILGQ